MPRHPRLTLLIASTVLVISWQCLLERQFLESLWYSRDAIFGGELWRIFSGHLVHHSVSHLLFNLVALVLLSWIIETKYSALTLIKLLLIFSLVTSVGLLLIVPNLVFYGGSSAINYGLLTWLSLQDRGRAFRFSGSNLQTHLKALIAPTLIVHCAFQWYFSSSLFSTNPGNPELVIAWQAHLISITAALMCQFSKSSPIIHDLSAKTARTHRKLTKQPVLVVQQDL